MNLSLRNRFFLYLAAAHLLFAVVAWLVLKSAVVWLIAIEGAFLLSLVIGVLLVRSLFVPLDLLRAGADFLRESDFTTRFAECGPPEMIELIQVYNRMADHLRQERIRNEEQEHFVRDVLESSTSGVITLDLDGRIVTVNPAAERLLGQTEGELGGLELHDVGSRFAEELAGLAPGDTRILRLQGRRRVRCQKLTYLDRGFHRPFLLLDELTEELHRTEKAAYGKLIRMMSHEVNNTVGAVNSLLQSCQSYREQLSSADAEDFGRALKVAMQRNDHMNEFMQGFAEVVRLPAPRKAPTDVRLLLEEVAQLMKPQCEKRGIVWRWDFEEQFDSVGMDPGQMEQVFINIIKNAMEAMGAMGNGTLTVRTALARGRGCVVVRDTGPGISPEVRERLFTPFFSTKSDGRGIGLTMVQEILLAHGFDFVLQGAQGGGTEFTILF